MFDVYVTDRGHGGGGAGVLMKGSCAVQRRQRYLSRRRAHAPSLHAARCPMTSSRCQLTWCDKVADSSSFCRASFWTPLDRRHHVTSAKPEVDSAPSLFTTPTSGGFVGTATRPRMRAPTYDFVFDVDMARRSRHYFRSPCCPPSCHVTTEIIDDERSAASSPNKEVVLPLAHAHRYVEGNTDDGDQQPEVNPTNSG